WDIASAWNTKILQSYVHHHYGISMSREALRKLLHRKGFRGPGRLTRWRKEIRIGKNTSKNKWI
ncbi:winged helix-turn-helix domain-containing protein, partial [Geobacillus stearothermophilus]|uniref:winged helix-turn-helix domain-containing protein n=1 Tax=Geobacillus stearothermophilus TaxID=1422 RepID=UPI003D1A3146